MGLLDAIQRVGQVLGPLCTGAALIVMNVNEAATTVGAGFLVISLAFLVLAQPPRKARRKNA